MLNFTRASRAFARRRWQTGETSWAKPVRSHAPHYRDTMRRHRCTRFAICNMHMRVSDSVSPGGLCGSGCCGHREKGTSNSLEHSRVTHAALSSSSSARDLGFKRTTDWATCEFKVLMAHGWWCRRRNGRDAARVGR